MQGFTFSWFDAVDLAFMAVFVLVFLLFVLDFRLVSRRSWMILLGMTGLGGLLLFKRWLRRQILRDLETKEKLLRQKEEALVALRQQAKITEAAYEAARLELEQAQKEHALLLARLDRELQQRLQDIEREYQHLTPEQTLQKLKSILSR